jgi:hypothetical protein
MYYDVSFNILVPGLAEHFIFQYFCIPGVSRNVVISMSLYMYMTLHTASKKLAQVRIQNLDKLEGDKDWIPNSSTDGETKALPDPQVKRDAQRLRDEST